MGKLVDGRRITGRDIVGFNQFQRDAIVTARYDGQYTTTGLMYCGLGVAGEAGEIADEVKKMWRNDGSLTPERREKIIDEVGDELWYLALICEEIDANLGECALHCIEKLRDRELKNQLKEHN